MRCHLLVHSFDDDPSRPLDMNEQTLLLPDAEYAEMANALRRAIKAAMA